METRNISITLEKAREWYNSSSSDLKEVALQAYTEEELKTPKFTNIKTFEQACEALGINNHKLNADLPGLGVFGPPIANYIVAVYKFDIIRKALNGDWKPSMVEGRIYYPFVRFYPADKAREAARSNDWVVKESFKADGKKYSLVGGDCSCYSCGGLAGFGYGYGDVLPDLGLLGCKSREIAEHMSRCFAKEIFEATYAQHIGSYEWV